MPSPEQISRNTNPVPADKLEKKIANALPTYTRRQFLKKTGMWVGAGLFLLGIGATGTVGRIIKENEEQQRVDEYSKIPREQVKTAEDQIRNFKKESERLEKMGKLEELPQVVNSENIKSSYDTLDAYEKRKKLEDKVWTTWDIAQVGIHALNILIALHYIKTGFFTAKKGLEDQSEAKRRFVDLVLDVRTDWRETPPTEEELIAFSQGLSYLPPVGGKIPLMWDKTGERYDLKMLLEPSLTAEQQANKVVEMRQRNELGEVYVHQLTVQGRLPDRFKYAALALILNSPYQNDWTKPFFEAPWGKIAPLIHDGGRVIVGYNPVWKNVQGRTDFLQRIAEIHEPQLEELERLDVKEIGRLSSEQLARARAEQEERDRFLIEARAYQRLGLALHCAVGTAPKTIPNETRVKLGQSWKEFEEKMRLLLSEYRILGVAEVEWFREEPVGVLGWVAKRSEANWPPIQEQLIAVEKVREKNPELPGKVTRLLIDIADRIDQEIGLLPKTKNLQN